MAKWLFLASMEIKKAFKNLIYRFLFEFRNIPSNWWTGLELFAKMAHFSGLPRVDEPDG
ncbi:hypothetical protein [Flagellimonas lutimaris]|uniref:hypothetical protein n=1 Tax=Flagellimonas lutimaris TaxID=475082 RepID=UPI003F5CF064